MKQCTILPKNHFHEFNEYNDYEFILAHVVKEDENLRDFYHNKETFKVLDNGEHEGCQISGQELIDLALQTRANEVICPDTLYDTKETIIKTTEFLDNYYEMLNEFNIQTMAVIQGKTIEEWMYCFERFNNDSRIDTLGVTFDFLPYETTNVKTLKQMNTRIIMMDLVKDKIKKQVHLLGLSNPIELKFQKKHSFIRSNDSTLPFNAVTQGIVFDEDKGLENKPSIHLDFDYKLDEEQKTDVHKNIQMIKRWIK